MSSINSFKNLKELKNNLFQLNINGKKLEVSEKLPKNFQEDLTELTKVINIEWIFNDYDFLLYFMSEEKV